MDAGVMRMRPMRILIVDDERITIDHVQTLIPWESHGYEIAGTATNGKRALGLCLELKPHIVLVDIRMPIMDGLELIRVAAERNLGIRFIVMSAHADFEYARQALKLGCVSGYLVKHELDAPRLLEELEKARKAWEADEAGRAAERSRRLRDAVLNGRFPDAPGSVCGVVVLQEDRPFASLPFFPEPDEPGAGLALPETELPQAVCGWTRAGAFAAGEGRLAVLFTAPGGMTKGSLRAVAAAVRERLAERPGAGVSCFYAACTGERAEFRHAYGKAVEAARHAVFCERQAVVDADAAPVPYPPLRTGACAAGIRLDELARGLNNRHPELIESAIKSLFARLKTPEWDLPGLYETVHILTRLYNERRTAAGLPAEDPLAAHAVGPPFRIGDIERAFAAAFVRAAGIGETRLSGKLRKAIGHIRAHYAEDLRIEDTARAVGISASYLHQLFKRELGRTYLDVLTEIRIEQAKRILREEDAKMADVSERVGYRSPQHFSQMFKRVTGMLPHQFREECLP
jgi:two-component system response regulator YesN